MVFRRLSKSEDFLEYFWNRTTLSEMIFKSSSGKVDFMLGFQHWNPQDSVTMILLQPKDFGMDYSIQRSNLPWNLLRITFQYWNPLRIRFQYWNPNRIKVHRRIPKERKIQSIFNSWPRSSWISEIHEDLDQELKIL